MTLLAFNRFLNDPRTGPKLDAALAEDARMAEAEKVGPRDCCAAYASIRECDGVTDRWICGICERTWTTPCPDLDVWKPES